MSDEYEPKTRDPYALIISLKEATELGLARVDRRFEEVENRFEGRLKAIERRLTSVEGILAGVERWAVRMDGRLASIEAQNVVAFLNDHERRIRTLEQRYLEKS